MIKTQQYVSTYKDTQRPLQRERKRERDQRDIHIYKQKHTEPGLAGNQSTVKFNSYSGHTIIATDHSIGLLIIALDSHDN